MQILRLKTGRELDFDAAHDLAGAGAGKHLAAPMLLSWLNRKTGRHSPNVDCCHEDGKEAWEIYAESRGGKLRVEVDKDYVFIYGEGLDAQ